MNKYLVLGVAGLVACVTPARGDGPEVNPQSGYFVSAWQCGGVTIRVEMWEAGVARYWVINPDAIPYVRNGGAPYFMVETRRDTVTLNGWPCRRVE